jgi:hypothetical protein
LYSKGVNPTGRPVKIALRVGDGFAVGGASLEVAASGSLKARNGLGPPDAVRPRREPAVVDGQAVRCTLPAHATAVVKITRRSDRGGTLSSAGRFERFYPEWKGAD